MAEIPTPPGSEGEARVAWLRRALGGRWDEIEGGPDYAAWRDAVVGALVQAGGAAVFTHYVAINAALSAALGDPCVLVRRPDHASVTTVDILDGRLVIHELGSEGATQVTL